MSAEVSLAAGRADAPPLVSVIMPCRNGEAFVEQSVRSALSQTLGGLELIVIDDASTDGTAPLLRRLAREDPRLRLLHNPERLGVARSRNLGIQHARGLYVAFLDSDDCWAAEKLRLQAQALSGAGRALCFTSYQPVRRDGSALGPPRLAPERVTYEGLLRENVIGCSTVMLPRSCLSAHPMRPEFFHEDYVLWLELLRDGVEAVGLRDVLVHYRCGGRSGNKLRAAKNRWRIYRRSQGLSLPRSAGYFLCYAAGGLSRGLLRTLPLRWGRDGMPSAAGAGRPLAPKE